MLKCAMRVALAVALAFLAGRAPAEEPAGRKLPEGRAARVVVLDFALAGSAHPDLARALADAAAAEAGKVPGLQVISQGEVVSLLGLERSKQMLGCSEDQGCMVELAGALNAERLLSGAVTVIEHTTLITVRLLDVRKSRTLNRAAATLLDATEAELMDAARRLAHEAVTGRKLDTTATIRVAVDRPGAQVSLDGKDLGLSPVPAQRVLEGPHQVVVQRKGFVRWSSTVSVAAGAEVPVQVQLVSVQLLTEGARSRLWTWGWMATGVAVAATGSGILFGRMAQSSYDDYTRATTRSQAMSLHDTARQRATFANVSWAVAGASGAAAATMLVWAAVADARAAAELAVAPAPLDGGGMVALGGRF